jgi:hypothetical protein
MTNATKKCIRDIALLVVGGLISYLVVPLIISRYNGIHDLQEARLKTAMAFGDHDTEINKKLNALGTLMSMFNSQNVRMKTAPTELKEAQTEFRKNYTERYLAFDELAWWKPGDFEREAGTLEQLSPDEMKELDQDIREYSDSVGASVTALRPLWHILSSKEYQLDAETQRRIGPIKDAMEQELSKQHYIRYRIVQRISRLFGESTFRTNTSNMYYIWRRL